VTSFLKRVAFSPESKRITTLQLEGFLSCYATSAQSGNLCSRVRGDCAGPD
jgi:hypothetical protein